MTVLSQTNKMDAQAMNGVATQFSFTFRALVDVEEAIKAVVTDTTTSTDTDLILNDGGVDGYTVTIDDDGVGGYITVNDARSTDYTITIYREYEETQISNYADYNSFPAETVEDDYDKGTMIDQQISEVQGRTLTLPITVTGVDTTLPVPEAGRPIGWNDTADGLTNEPSLVYQLQVDVDATPDYLGATSGDGVLRVNTANLSYADGGDFVTLDTIQNIGTTASPTFNNLTLTTLTMTQAINIILDEDDLVSDRDDALATQQSIKAYIDTEISGVYSDPLTTRGDILVRDATNTTARLPIGADTYVLTSDGTDASWQPSSGGGGSASTVTYDVTQATHGFSVGDVLRHNGTSYTEAQADSETNAEVIGIVSAVADVNNFTLQVAGRITGLSGLTAGSAHFLDETTAGAMTDTAPTTDGEVTKPILVADSTTSGYIYNMRGLVVGSGGGGGGASLSEDITQATHGFAVGDWLRLSGTSYVKAQADSVANAESVGVVSAVADVNNFTLQFGGKVTGLSGLSADDTYFIDESTAGAITNTAPSAVGEVVKPVLIADSTTSGYIFNMRGSENVTAPATVVGADAYARFNSTTLGESHNVTSITHSSTGQYVVNFTNAFANANYAVVSTAQQINVVCDVTNPTTTSVQVNIQRRSDGAYINAPASVIVFGTLA